MTSHENEKGARNKVHALQNPCRVRVKIPLGPAQVLPAQNIIDYLLFREKLGLGEQRLRTDTKIIKILAKNCDLTSDSVFSILGNQSTGAIILFAEEGQEPSKTVFL